MALTINNGLPYLLPRVGIGTDAHAYAELSAEGAQSERACMMAGLEWPGEQPLAGHSDADVAAHAMADALLSAAGQGSLGTHFGVDRPEWAGASGCEILRETTRILTEAGWGIGNVSVQIIANRPRIGKRFQEAQEVLSKAIGGAAVSVSATTTDHLGFTGRGQGAAAIATALVYALPTGNLAQ